MSRVHGADRKEGETPQGDIRFRLFYGKQEFVPEFGGGSNYVDPVPHEEANEPVTDPAAKTKMNPPQPMEAKKLKFDQLTPKPLLWSEIKTPEDEGPFSERLDQFVFCVRINESIRLSDSIKYPEDNQALRSSPFGLTMNWRIARAFLETDFNALSAELTKEVTRKMVKEYYGLGLGTSSTPCRDSLIALEEIQTSRPGNAFGGYWIRGNNSNSSEIVMR